MRSLLQGATDEQAATIVPTCPDWSVKDLVSHVTGICVDLSSGNPPTDDVQGWVDRQVAERTEQSAKVEQVEWRDWSTDGVGRVGRVARAVSGTEQGSAAQDNLKVGS